MKLSLKKLHRALALAALLAFGAVALADTAEPASAPAETPAPAPVVWTLGERPTPTPVPAIDNFGEESVEGRIYVYNQRGGPACDREWALKAIGGNDLDHGGCHIYAYANIIQWLTGRARTEEDGGELLDELIAVYNAPWDGTAQLWYDRHVKHKYGLRSVRVPETEDGVIEFFRQGGVLLINPGRHYVVGVGAVYADLDGDGRKEVWIHVVDSVVSTTITRLGKKGYFIYTFDTHEMVTYVTEYDFTDRTHGGTWEQGGEYWLPFRTYRSAAVRRDKAYLPEDASDRADALQFIDVVYPSTYVIGNEGWFLEGGALVSDHRLNSIRSRITDDAGNVFSDSGEKGIEGYTYPISGLETRYQDDSGVRFSRINQPGTYYWVLTAEDTAGQTLTLSMPIQATTSGRVSTSTVSLKIGDDPDKAAP